MNKASDVYVDISFLSPESFVFLYVLLYKQRMEKWEQAEEIQCVLCKSMYVEEDYM